MVSRGIRVDRCGCLCRPMRMVKYAEGVGKKGAWEVRGRCVRGFERGCGRGAWVWQDAIPSYGRSL